VHDLDNNVPRASDTVTSPWPKLDILLLWTQQIFGFLGQVLAA
jgi:hypothetical protein